MRRATLAVFMLTLGARPAAADLAQVEGSLVGWSPDNTYLVLRWNDEWQSTNYQPEKKDDDVYKLCPVSEGPAPSWPKSVPRPRPKERCASLPAKAFQKLKLQLVPAASKAPAGLKADSGENSLAVLTGKWRIVQQTDGGPGDAMWRPDGKAVAFEVNACTGTGEWCWPETTAIDFAWSLAGQPPPPANPCHARPHTSFHLRVAEALEQSGPELPRATQLDVLSVTKLSRGAARLYQVKAKPRRGPAQTGYAFLTADELTKGICPE